MRLVLFCACLLAACGQAAPTATPAVPPTATPEARRAALVRQIDEYEALYQRECPTGCKGYVADTLWQKTEARFRLANPEVDRYITWYLAARNRDRSIPAASAAASRYTFAELRDPAYLDRFLAGRP